MKSLTFPGFLTLVITGVVIPVSAASKDPASATWSPANGAVTTRWAKDVSPQNSLPDYPRPQLLRADWLNLNGLWQMEFGKADDAPPLNKELSLRILVPFPVESALSGVMKRADRLWYRRTFQIPETWRSQRVLLHFQAVDWESAVYVNGKLLGVHRGGYDAFSFDITDALRPGGDQEVIVRVFDPTSVGNQPRGKQSNKARGIWYTPVTGIWQTVWLEPVSKTRVDRLVLTPDLDQSMLKVRVEGIEAGKCKVQVVARAGGTEVARSSGAIDTDIQVRIPKDQLKTWSPDAPFLYDLTVTLALGDRMIDQVQSYFGMREIDVGKDEHGRARIRLNGRPIFLTGPLDQGYWPDGLYTAPTDAALRYDIEVTKKLGFNMTRKHVKVEPDRWYYWCDKLGLMVWQDMPNGDNLIPGSQLASDCKVQFETELGRLVEGFRNHPSIIMWIVFNEGWGLHDAPRYADMVKKMDPTRLVNSLSGVEMSAANSSRSDPKAGDILDIHMYRHPKPPPPQSNRAGVIGECGGIPLAYPANADFADGTRHYEDLLKGFHAFHDSQALSAIVYTQLTNVENERNGLMTYDRSIIQVDESRVAAANRGP